MNIAVLQIVTDNISDYFKYVAPINSQYCVKHNYDYVIKNITNKHKDQHPSFSKIPELKRFMEINIKEYDWIMILDADAIFNNHDLKLETIINDAGDKSLLICDDSPNGGLINCGSMLFRCEYNITSLLETWEIIGYQNNDNINQYWEQATLKREIERKNLKFTSKIKIYPTDTFNSHWLSMPTDNLIHHYMARSTEDRANLLQKRYREFFKSG